MNTEKIISREYKIMLFGHKFVGNEAKVIKVAHRFWSDFKKAVRLSLKDTHGNFNTISGRREIRFIDTKGFVLHSNDYLFRERIDIKSGEREVTLKFRHPDRYFSQDRNMTAKKGSKRKLKFEEDIKPVFLELYSFSSSQKISGKQELKKLKDVVELYPDLAKKLDYYNKQEKIRIVNGFSVYEMVITGAKFKVGNSPDVNSECAIIIWHDRTKPRIKPVVVEFSFRYSNKKGKYNRKTAQHAYNVFKKIQEELGSWMSVESPTKTAFMYTTKRA